MGIRSIAAGFFLVLGALLTIPASVAVWQERTILDEDNFVETVGTVLDQEDVQVAVASRMADAVMVQLDVQNRIDAAIVGLEQSRQSDGAPGLTILEGPIVSTAREAIYRVCLRIVQSDFGASARDLILRELHRAFMALIQNDGAFLRATRGQVVMDLRPAIDEAIREISAERIESALSERLDADAGQVTLVQSRSESPVWRLLGLMDDFNPWIPAISVGLLAIAVILSTDRTRMIGVVGAAIVGTSALVLFVAASPAKELATNWPPRKEGQDAAAAAYDVILDSFRRQELYLGLIGIGLVGFSAVARQPNSLRAIRTTISGGAGTDEGSGVRSWVLAHLTALRAAGLAVAAIVLLFWPDPTRRVLVTMIGLLAAYLIVLWVIASDTPAAASLRTHASKFLKPTSLPVSNGRSHWVGRWAGVLRVGGVAVALASLVLFPELSLRLLILVSVATLFFLAIVDYFAST